MHRHDLIVVVVTAAASAPQVLKHNNCLRVILVLSSLLLVGVFLHNCGLGDAVRGRDHIHVARVRVGLLAERFSHSLFYRF